MRGSGSALGTLIRIHKADPIRIWIQNNTALYNCFICFICKQIYIVDLLIGLLCHFYVNIVKHEKRVPDPVGSIRFSQENYLNFDKKLDF